MFIFLVITDILKGEAEGVRVIKRSMKKNEPLLKEQNV